MGTEIERKFRLVRPIRSEDLRGAARRTEILQGYLPVPLGEVRLRRKVVVSTISGGTTYALTAKGDGDISREEDEVQITKMIFDAMWPINDGIIEKSRFMFDAREWGCKVRGFYSEFDIYAEDGPLNGLQVLESEFDTLEQAAQFILPPWAADAIEVTDDKRFKNKNLARSPEAVSEFLLK